MSKHTPGPWIVEPARSEGFCISSPCELVVISEDEYGHYGPIRNEANANLIAAAPDLLEALERIKYKMEQGLKPYHALEFYGDIITAIARAKGES